MNTQPLTFKELAAFALRFRDSYFNILDGNTWLAAACMRRERNIKYHMSNYHKGYDTTHQQRIPLDVVPKLYGDICEFIVERAEKLNDPYGDTTEACWIKGLDLYLLLKHISIHNYKQLTPELREHIELNLIPEVTMSQEEIEDIELTTPELLYGHE